MRLGFCINTIMKNITKKSCPDCNANISAQNYKRHVITCGGKGTSIHKEELRKYQVKNTIYNCKLCSKTFTTAQALSGHTQRSHILKDKQAEYGKKGSITKLEMADRGEISISYPHSEETKNLMSIIACERLAKHSKYSKNTEYKPGIILESSFEVRTAIILDSLNIEWTKVRKGYIWDDNGKTRRYIPDFYLPDYNIFLDPKNDYLIKKDKKKIDSAMLLNNIKVVVLSDSQISETFIKDLLL
jgi:hypothetical protein